MTIQEWAREARDLFKKIYDNEVSFFRCKEMGDLLAAYPEGESGKESDTVQKKLELYGSMVINVRSLRTFLTQYHPSYTRWIEEIDFILARAALLEEAVRLLKISYRHLPQLYGETEDELLQGQIQNFLARAKEALNNAKI
jgi:DNA integrity scanning protein DisA with diadenylate cyclase activity